VAAAARLLPPLPDAGAAPAIDAAIGPATAAPGVIDRTGTIFPSGFAWPASRAISHDGDRASRARTRPSPAGALARRDYFWSLRCRLRLGCRPARGLQEILLPPSSDSSVSVLPPRAPATALVLVGSPVQAARAAGPARD